MFIEIDRLNFISLTNNSLTHPPILIPEYSYKYNIASNGHLQHHYQLSHRIKRY